MLPAGVQKVGTAASCPLEPAKPHSVVQKIIGLIMARTKKYCLTLKNWTFGSLTGDINTLSNTYWTHCPMNIEYYAS